MTIEEMKLMAIDQIHNLKSEVAVKEILAQLKQLTDSGSHEFDAEAFFKIAAEKYDDVLQKLAQ